jgi:hypothetical protein
MLTGEFDAVASQVKQNEREIRRLRVRLDSFSAGSTLRATSFGGGVIPAANRPVEWYFNTNLLGLGDELELHEGLGVWISASFASGRAHYLIGAYCAPPCGGPGGGGMSGVDFLLDSNWLCAGQALNLLEGPGVWISGTCVLGVASYILGAYCEPPCGGGGGASGTVYWEANGAWFCDSLVADLQEESGVWISGECTPGGVARYHIGATGGVGGGDDILALAYAVAF